MICKGTHQVKYKGSYFKKKRTLCKSISFRDQTTTSENFVTCTKCIGIIIVAKEKQIKQMRYYLDTQKHS